MEINKKMFKDAMKSIWKFIWLPLAFFVALVVISIFPIFSAFTGVCIILGFFGNAWAEEHDWWK